MHYICSIKLEGVAKLVDAVAKTVKSYGESYGVGKSTCILS